MIPGSTDRHWEKFGAEDPYFGVVTHDRFKTSNLNEQNLEAFFASGEEYVEAMWRKIERHLVENFAPRRALDFGCGVGRLAIPLARRSGEVHGLDVSASMLREAQKNCESRSIDNVRLLASDDGLTALSDSYDLVHSFIVFQHIPVPRGRRIFEGLVERLAPGGVGVLHFTYAKSFHTGTLRRAASRVIGAARGWWQIVLQRTFLQPRMQMNVYSIEHVLLALQQRGIRNVYSEFTNHGGCLGLVLYFRRDPND